MSSEAPTHPNTTHENTVDSRAKRVPCSVTATSTSSPASTVKPSKKSLSPVEASFKFVVSTYVESLHPDLQAFFLKPLQDLFKTVATAHWKEKKH